MDADPSSVSGKSTSGAQAKCSIRECCMNLPPPHGLSLVEALAQPFEMSSKSCVSLLSKMDDIKQLPRIESYTAQHGIGNAPSTSCSLRFLRCFLVCSISLLYLAMARSLPATLMMPSKGVDLISTTSWTFQAAVVERIEMDRVVTSIGETNERQLHQDPAAHGAVCARPKAFQMTESRLAKSGLFSLTTMALGVLSFFIFCLCGPCLAYSTVRGSADKADSDGTHNGLWSDVLGILQYFVMVLDGFDFYTTSLTALGYLSNPEVWKTGCWYRRAWPWLFIGVPSFGAVWIFLCPFYWFCHGYYRGRKHNYDLLSIPTPDTKAKGEKKVVEQIDKSYEAGDAAYDTIWLFVSGLAQFDIGYSGWGFTLDALNLMLSMTTLAIKIVKLWLGHGSCNWQTAVFGIVFLVLIAFALCVIVFHQ